MRFSSIHLALRGCVCAAVLSCVACVPSLNPLDPPASDRDPLGTALFLIISEQDIIDETLACDIELDGNTRITAVTATSGSNWSYCDLGTLATVDEFNAAWDLRFQRFRISTNSGTTDSGDGGSCNTGSTDFDSVTSSTACTIQADVSLSVSIGGAGGTDTVDFEGADALKEWYDYNSSTHVLTAKDDVYLIRSSDGGSIYKIQMTDYYSESGTSGYPTFRWESL